MTTNQPMTATPPGPPHEAHLSGHVHGEEAVVIPRGHGMTELERFWIRVDRRSDDECWEWRGYRIPPWGYGKFYMTKVEGQPRRMVRAHRYSYELMVGPIPDGLFVLHQCDNPPCVNPAHLKVGTHDDNMAEKVARGRAGRPLATHCKRGHEFTEENSYWPPSGKRHCRTCTKERQAKRTLARKVASSSTVVSRGVTAWREQA